MKRNIFFVFMLACLICGCGNFSVESNETDSTMESEERPENNDLSIGQEEDADSEQTNLMNSRAAMRQFMDQYTLEEIHQLDGIGKRRKSSENLATVEM